MNVFVSSRLLELLIERKIAIETIHFSGHTPIYIETEPLVRDAVARDTMLSLLSNADAFLSIHYLSEGRRTAILDHMTPIEFELSEFLRRRPKAPVFIFRRVADELRPSSPMAAWFESVASELHRPIVNFDSPAALQFLLAKELKHFRNQTDYAGGGVFSIRYIGPDIETLVRTITATLFVSFQLNVDSVAYSARGGYATVHLSCSSRARAPLTIAAIQQTLSLALEYELSNRHGGVASKAIFGHSSFELIVSSDDVVQERSDLELEARMIDAPGQLNALCTAVIGMSYHVDDLTQAPAPWEYPRQTLITLRLSRHRRVRDNIQTDVGELESKLQYLAGLRALSLRPLSSAGIKDKSATLLAGTTELPPASLRRVSMKSSRTNKRESIVPPKESAEARFAIPSTGSQNQLVVFLCHASQDKPRVRKLYTRLKADGFRPWLDENDLLAGQNWLVEIQRAVRRSHAVLICLSPVSVSKSGPLQTEIKVALQVLDEQPDGMIFVVPVRMAECVVPFALQQLTRVDLFKPNGYRRLRDALKARAEQIQGAWPTQPKL